MASSGFNPTNPGFENLNPTKISSWADDIEEGMDEAQEKGLITIPPVATLLGTVQEIEERMEASLNSQASDPEKEKKEELSQMMFESAIETEINTHPRVFVKPSKSVRIEKAEEKTEVISDSFEAESFASQRETAELRGELEVFSMRIKNLESILETVLKERSALPAHLARIQEDINAQLTLMSDKLQASLESDIPREAMVEAASTVVAAGVSANDSLHAAKSFLSGPPSNTSPITRSDASLLGKRRFKPRK